jgi:integrase
MGIPNGLTEKFSPHILRHTWNDRFSKEMERNQVPESMEVKLRNEMNGWSPNSKMAWLYTRRYIKERAKAILLADQARILDDE